MRYKALIAWRSGSEAQGGLPTRRMGYEVLFHPLYGRERLGKLVREDPEMLDLALGALFRYNPS